MLIHYLLHLHNFPVQITLDLMEEKSPMDGAQILVGAASGLWSRISHGAYKSGFSEDLNCARHNQGTFHS